MQKISRAHVAGYITVVAVSVAFLFGLWTAGVFGGVDHFLEDRITRDVRSVDPSLVIVGIDDASLARIGRWPWPRSVFGRLIDKLNVSHPAAVGIDVSFSDTSTVSDDAALASALQRANFPIVLPVEGTLTWHDDQGMFSYSADPLLPHPHFITPSTTVGAVNVITDPDGVVRSFPFSVRMPDGSSVDSFAVALLRAAGKWSGHQSSASLTRIAYAGPPHAIYTVPSWRVLDGSVSIPAHSIILIGATAPDLHDTVVVPTGGGVEMSGVEVHATIVNMLLGAFRLVVAPWWAVLGWCVVCGLLAVGAVATARSMSWAIGLVVAEGVVATVMIVGLAQLDIIFPVIYGVLGWFFPALGAFFYRYWVTEKERAAVRSLFSRYVSKEVLSDILKNPSALSLGGKEREITVLFSDIRGFTTLSESLPPHEVVRILNDYFSAMTEEIIAHGGVLDKYIGDAIMAFWGAPLADALQASHAIDTALAMRRRLESLNREFAARHDPRIQIGIGIATGNAVAGNVGSLRRLNYTVIGDTVNTASRLEGLTKEKNVPIIISQQTKERAGDRYDYIALGAAMVKGKKKEVMIFGVRDEARGE
jgi:adenylate cyclase